MTLQVDLFWQYPALADAYSSIDFFIDSDPPCCTTAHKYLDTDRSVAYEC